MKIILRLYMAILVIVFVISCGDQTTDQQQNEAKTQTTYSADDFYKTTSISGSSINHDGTAVLISNDATGIFNAYRQPLDGSAPTHLTIQQWTAHLPLAGFPMMTGYCIMQTKAVMS